MEAVYFEDSGFAFLRREGVRQKSVQRETQKRMKSQIGAKDKMHVYQHDDSV